MLKTVSVLATAATLFAVATPASAKEVVIQMRNKGAQGLMVFEPAYVAAAPGDTIRFVPTDKGHNAEPIPEIMPAGVTLSKGRMNAEYLVKLDKAGVYGFKCLPHYGMGMVALVKVGKVPPAQLAAARAAKTPPLAAKRLAPMLAQVK
jgi:pseudoazurin